MLGFLINRFIKGDKRTPENRQNIINLTGYMGLAINILLFSIKFILGLVINSISITADSFNNLSDSLNSIITIAAAKLSKKPADENHPFGHGRSEYIATLAIGISIIIVGLQLLKSAIAAIFSKEANTISFVAIGIMVLTIFFKLYMYLYNKKVYKMLDSDINRSQMIDSRNDVIVTSFVVIALIIKRLTDLDLEPYAAILLSVMIIKSGVEIFADMGRVLLGHNIDDRTKEKLINILISGEYVRGIHGIEIHNYGHDRLVGSTHLEVPGNIDLYTMHNIIDELELRVKRELNIDLTIHMDPSYLLEQDAYARLDPKVFDQKEINED